jgi:iron complex outermembrane receptor protein
MEAFQTELGIFSGSHISTPEAIRNAFKRADSTYQYSFGYEINRPSQKIRHFLSRGKLEFRQNEKNTIQLIYSHQIDHRQEFDIIRKSARCQTCPQLEFYLSTNQIDLSHKYSKEGFESQTGLIGFFQSNNTQRSNLIPDFNLSQYSIYNINYWFKKRWAYEIGLRSEIRNLHIFLNNGSESRKQYFNFMANAGVRYEISDHWHSKCNLQYSRRAPNVNEMYSNGVHHGSASFELGDPALKQEKILNLTYSLHHRSEKWELLINLFETYSPNFIYISPVKDSIVYTIRGPFPFFQYQSSRVNLRGGDFFIQYNPYKRFGFFSKGSLIRSWNLSENDWLIFQQADRLETGIEFTSVESKGGFQYSIRFCPQWVARQFRVPQGRDFTEPPPAYLLWGGNISVSSKKTRIPFDFSIEGQNLGNAAYRDYMNRFRYFAYDLGQNFRFRLSLFFNETNR